jgi:excisionase family DNA binding protein
MPTKSTPAEVPRIVPTHLYGYAQAAEVLGVNKYFVRNLVKDGRLKSIPVNDRGDRRVVGRDLLAFLEDGAQ